MDNGKIRLRPRRKSGPKVFKDGKKRCNCPIHQGEYISLDKFWVFKTGRMAGKPMSRCVEGLKLQKGTEAGKSGYVPFEDVKFIFMELERKIGKAETCRRMGVSQNLWMRTERRLQTKLRKATVAKAIEVLREVRANEEVRHRDSIRHGASARGKKEREVKSQRDLNLPQGDNDNERRRNYNAIHPESVQRQSAKKKERKQAQQGASVHTE